MQALKLGVLAGAVALALLYLVANTERGRQLFFSFTLPGGFQQ